MIEMAQSTTCKACGKPIVQAPGGHRARLYCDAACKMRDRRRRQSEKHQEGETDLVTAQARIATLEKQVRDLEARLAFIQENNERF
jgi:hypothetical protein